MRISHLTIILSLPAPARLDLKGPAGSAVADAAPAA